MELLFPAVFILALAEWAASGFWWPAYFRSGLRVYRKATLLPSHLEVAAGELTARFETPSRSCGSPRCTTSCCPRGRNLASSEPDSSPWG